MKICNIWLAIAIVFAPLAWGDSAVTEQGQAQAQAQAQAYQAISLEGFADGIRHWKKFHDKFEYPRCDVSNITCIGDNILLYQRINGGWPENEEPTRLLSDVEKSKLLAERSATDTSLDNRNIFTQITYLAEVYRQTNDAKYRDAAERGLEFILQYQYSNGGWPHSPPRIDKYYGYITLADEVMPGVLTLLRQVSERRRPFQFVSKDLLKRCSEALHKGDRLVLDLQVKQNGKLTGWAGQYHPQTLAPIGARSFELPGLVSLESVGVLHYLMSIEAPSAEVVQAVEAAVDWLEASKLSGFRVDKVAAEKERFKYHSSDWDRVVVNDKNAPPIWARFYELDTNRPFMANRDGGKVFRLSDVARERRTGYGWYGYWPQVLLEKDYPEWKKRL